MLEQYNLILGRYSGADLTQPFPLLQSKPGAPGNTNHVQSSLWDREAEDHSIEVAACHS